MQLFERTARVALRMRTTMTSCCMTRITADADRTRPQVGQGLWSPTGCSGWKDYGAAENQAASASSQHHPAARRGEVSTAFGMQAADRRTTHRLHPNHPGPAGGKSAISAHCGIARATTSTRSHGATIVAGGMAAALHFDLAIPTSGCRRYMRHAPQPMRYSPTAILQRGFLHPGDQPGSESISMRPSQAISYRRVGAPITGSIDSRMHDDHW